MMQNQEEV